MVHDNCQLLLLTSSTVLARALAAPCDLIVAHHFSKRVGVYSLEGCVRQGFTPRLDTLNWQQKVVIPEQSVDKAARIRRVVFLVLWAGAHVVYFVIAILLATAWLVRLFLRRRGRRKPRVVTTAIAK